MREESGAGRQNQTHYGIFGAPLCGAAVTCQEGLAFVQEREDVTTCAECRQLLAREAIAHPVRVTRPQVSLTPVRAARFGSLAH